MVVMQRKALILASLALLASSAWSGAATDIAFGITSSTAFSLPHYIATEKKYYETENLAVDTIVAGAAVGVLKQLAAGSLNIAQAATDQSLRAILHGAPIKIIAGAASNAPFRVLAAKNIARWSDLKGKTISVGGLTDVTLYFVRVMARKNGLADHEYDLIYGGGTPSRFAQLASGAAAAAILTNPVDFTALGVCRSRQRAAIPAELGAEQYSRRYPLGAVEPGAHPRVPAGTYQSNEISL
jgi:ABC-type nitrate/sulfonate/bicarbonate transport system substrate-binding protein